MDEYAPLRQRLAGLNIYLIGLMGAGKTTVGRELARALDYRFFDSDELIERVAQQTISEIFAHQGDAAFRDLETQVLQQLSACARSVIATGGGMVLRQQNWGYLQSGLTVWLDAPVELLVQRLADDQSRPLLATEDRAATLHRLLQERRSRYAEADLTLSVTTAQTPVAIAQNLLAKIPSILKTPRTPRGNPEPPSAHAAAPDVQD